MLTPTKGVGPADFRQVKSAGSDPQNETPGFRSRQETEGKAQQASEANRQAAQPGGRVVRELTLGVFKSDAQLRIDLHKDSGSFVYKSVDPESGEVISQWPAEQILKARSYLREIAAQDAKHNVDEEA